jgi:hypothetical protein
MLPTSSRDRLQRSNHSVLEGNLKRARNDPGHRRHRRPPFSFDWAEWIDFGFARYKTFAREAGGILCIAERAEITPTDDE